MGSGLLTDNAFILLFLSFLFIFNICCLCIDSLSRFSVSERLSGRCANICRGSREEGKGSPMSTSAVLRWPGFSDLCVPFCAEDSGCWCVNITELADALDTISAQPGIADFPNLKCAVQCGQHIA